MTQLLLGKPVADSIYKRVDSKVEKLKLNGVIPQVALVRVGDDPASMSYENMIAKKASEHGILAKLVHFSNDVSQDEFFQEVQRIDCKNIHGFLYFQPIPKQIQNEKLFYSLNPDKDIDCITYKNSSKLYLGGDSTFVPATAKSVLEILDFYGIDLQGKNAVIVGRSQVIGKPLSMLMLKRNATVTIAHSHTRDLAKITQNAEIVVLAVGKANYFDEKFFTKGQVVIDVGTNVCEDGKLTGDVFFERVEKIVEAITPVPKGVGSVTTSVLLDSVCNATNIAIL